MRVVKKITAFLAACSLLIIPCASLFILPTQAAVSDWQKGATLVPQSTTNFGSQSFDQSLENLHNTGADAVALVVPYYQSNVNSTDIAPGWNTPTDASLGAAIDYAHSLGMSVTIKMLVDSYDGQWRAYINPSDRNAWFGAYQYYLTHLGTIVQAHHAEMIDIGTELVSMTATTINSTNTAHWVSMIQALRAIYSGKLTYGANSNDGSDSPYTDEKRFVGFWPELDYVGLSAYYDLTYNGSVQSLEGSWDYWNTNDVESFETQVGKPILLMEVGYESTDGTSEQPWNFDLNGGVNEQEQADDYQALLSYWNKYPYIAGVYFWDWSTSPNAGGSGDTGYSPQNKQAQQILTQWFGNPTPPSQSTSTSTQSGDNQWAAAYTAGGSANPPSTTVGTPVAITATLTPANNVSTILVDVEVYDANNNKVDQQFYQDQSINAGQSQSYTFNWTPQTTGGYRVTVGVFNNDWSANPYWDNDTFDIAVASAQNAPTPPSQPSNPPSEPSSPTSSAAIINQNGQSIRVGGTLDFTGRNFSHEQNVTVTLNGPTVGSAHADGGGNFSTGSITAPSTVGNYVYTFSDSAGDSVGATISVTQ